MSARDALPGQQPVVDVARLRLIFSGYEHAGLLLDLWGTHDADGYFVDDVALTSDVMLVSLAELISGPQMAEMSVWLDDTQPSAHALLLVSQDEARAERAQWERSMRMQV